MRASGRWTRLLVPVAIVAIAVPILALAEASLVYIQTILGQSQTQFVWIFGRILIPWGVLALLMPVLVLLARKLPLAGPQPILTGLLHAGASLVFGATHLFLLVLVWKVFGNQPTPLLSFTAGLISRYMLQDVFLYWTVVGGLQVFWHQRALRERELAQARLSAELAQARLAALESRLEPHFLFNTLNTAVMLVRGNERERAVEVLVELSELLRVVIDGAPAHQVPLHEEWAFIRRYLALAQARFEDRLTVRLHHEPGLEDQLVPFLILQPLVENALRHGIGKRTDDGPGHVEVVALRQGDRLELEVWDNGPGLGPVGSHAYENPHGGIGLANVRARLRELYGERGKLRVEAAPGGGTVAHVLLPLIQ